MVERLRAVACAAARDATQKKEKPREAGLKISRARRQAGIG
ncbi:hypothetical protein [Burkholderia sp. GS2Y]|uniref:Uncharacterized protein n=1 Tax=Burkholderia theae TaxID=3143496 RepID=A0ABU9WUK5_9BURK